MLVDEREDGEDLHIVSAERGIFIQTILATWLAKESSQTPHAMYACS